MARHRWAWAKDGSATATCEVCGLKQAPERRASKRKTRAWGYTDTVTVTVWTHRDGRVEYGDKTPPCELAEAQTGLRPCPFCGAAPKIGADVMGCGNGPSVQVWRIFCDAGRHEASTDYYHGSLAAAAAEWNRRA